MTDSASTGLGRPPLVKYVVTVLVMVLLGVAIGHQYVLTGLDTLYFGLPLWLWVQIAVVSGMLVVAWVAVRLYTDAVEGGL